ncbi:MAG: hypothetical protein ACTHJL_14100 [Amnibacterium sp.]
MSWVPLVVAATVVAVVAVWGGLDRRALRRQGRLPEPAALGGLMAPLDEVFHPNAHAAAEIREAEQGLPAPAPSPGDPPASRERHLNTRLPDLTR